MTKHILASLAAVAALAACSKPNQNQQQQAPTCPTNQTCVDQVTPAQAADYFSQFQYKQLGDCHDLSTVRFQWLTFESRDEAVIARTQDGNDVVAELNLYLTADGKYTGEYQENVQQLQDSGAYKNIGVQNKRDLTGTWSVQGAQLLISDLGTGDVANVNNWPGVSMKISGTDLNAALNGQTLLMVNRRSMISKDRETADQVCKEQK